MRSKSGANALLLNASYEPLTVISIKRAIILLLAQKAESLENDEELTWGSPSYQLPVPIVLRLTKYVKVPHVTSIGLSKRALMARDGGKCQYCGKTDNLTKDHVIPKSRGGIDSWTNVVVACSSCNRTKGNKTLEELGWKLRVQPKAPTGHLWRIVSYRTPDPRWKEYLT